MPPNKNPPYRLNDEQAGHLVDSVNSSAQIVRTLLVTFSVFSIYLLISFAGTTHADLLLDSPIKLPFFQNVELPLKGFYLVTPWIYLLFFFNMMLQIFFLAQKVHYFQSAGLTRNTDDRVHLEQRLGSFLLVQFLLRNKYPYLLQVLLRLAFSIVIIILPIVVILYAQIQFLPYHYNVATWSQRLCSWLCICILWYFVPAIVYPIERRNDWYRRILRPINHACSSILWSAKLTNSLLRRSPASAVRATDGAVPERSNCQQPADASFSLFVFTILSFVVGIAAAIPHSFVYEHSPKFLRKIPIDRNLLLAEQVLFKSDSRSESINLLTSEGTATEDKFDKVVGLNLSNRDLRGANFENAVVPKADFRGADLRGANFAGAKIHLAQFGGAFKQDRGECGRNLYLDGISFEAANLLKARFECVVGSNVVFRSAKLKESKFRTVIFDKADFHEADLRGAFLEYSSFRGVNFYRSKLEGARIVSTDLQYAFALDADFKKASFDVVGFGNAYASGADFRGADFIFVDFYRAALDSADFRKASIRKDKVYGVVPFSFRGSLLMGTNFEGVDLSKLDFRNAIVFDAKFRGSDLSEAALSGAIIVCSDFHSAKLPAVGKGLFSQNDEKTDDMLSPAPEIFVDGEFCREGFVDRWLEENRSSKRSVTVEDISAQMVVYLGLSRDGRERARKLYDSGLQGPELFFQSRNRYRNGIRRTLSLGRLALSAEGQYIKDIDLLAPAALQLPEVGGMRADEIDLLMISLFIDDEEYARFGELVKALGGKISVVEPNSVEHRSGVKSSVVNQCVFKCPLSKTDVNKLGPPTFGCTVVCSSSGLGFSFIEFTDSAQLSSGF